MAGRNGNIESKGGDATIAQTPDLAVMLDAAFVAYYDDIRASLRRRGADQHQATEIVHDLYLLLSGRSERLLGKTSLRAYLIRAAHNLGIDRARRRAFEQRLFAALDGKAHAIPAMSVPIEARLDLSKRILALKQAIFALPPQCRNVFIAHRIAGMGRMEIAEALGIGKGMVDRHLRKAMLHCLEKMEEFEER